MSHKSKQNAGSKSVVRFCKKGGEKPADRYASSAAIARRGLRTATDVIELGLAMVVDVVLDAMPPDRVNAAANMLGKVSKYIQMREKHGGPSSDAKSKEMRLLPTA